MIIAAHIIIRQPVKHTVGQAYVACASIVYTKITVDVRSVAGVVPADIHFPR